MKKLDTYKKSLEAEKKVLEAELATVGVKDPQSRGGIQAVSDVLDISEADENELADKFESLDNNELIEEKLEERMEDVIRALALMEAGKYGICIECGLPIEEKRLDADATAVTCIMHMNMDSGAIEEEEEVA